ncbi:fatty acid-binding protein 2-like [Melitaea cinxia]|uniref:fatty acid-binding protein 2-like n=1 Tax=Melitaea cinxia TaxID=113334 RepID=UPI0004EA48AE|nr:fatty acid-binding protein 2-like [Melitaea cinxia]
MAYLGKSYKFVKSENMDKLLAHFGIPAEKIQDLIKTKPTQKLEKSGDGYVLTTIDDKTTELKFKEGVEFDEKVTEEFVAKTSFSVSGDVVTQTQKFADGRVVTIKRKYNGDELVVEITASTWDGVAHRYYTAA